MYDDIVKSLIPLIEEFRHLPNCELEGILGVYDNQFTSGVDFTYWKRLYTALETSSVWKQRINANHMATYTFPSSLRARYLSDGKSEVVEKTTIATVDLKCPSRKYDLRINLKCELPVSSDRTTYARPLSVRLQERATFLYKSNWKYDFTKVATGQTKALACKEPPTFEVEIELGKSNLDELGGTNELIALHLIYKLSDLLGRYDSSNQKQDIKIQLARVKWYSPTTSSIGKL
jgi:hypothetical protein